MNIAFLAPLKPPDHPEPSGDRTMARLLVRALERAGCTVELGSGLRMLDRTGADTPGLAEAARAEADRFLAAMKARPPSRRPDLVFTYHVFYKAPDVAGPRLAAGLGIPYVVAEGSRAPRRAGGPWDAGHRLAEAALDAADLVLVLNERDRPQLERSRPARQQIESLPPFVDGAGWPDAPARTADGQGAVPLRLLAVAMMRRGDKAASYALLAEALGRLEGDDWTLDVAGDGPERRDVEALFAPFGRRVVFHGRVDDPVALARLYASADLLAWPAVNEAFGMVFLEAALQGCPAVAGAFGGVPGVVVDGVTGRLAEPGSAEAFAAALAELGRDRPRLRRMGEAARRFAREDRSLDRAAGRLGGLLREVVRRRSAA